MADQIIREHHDSNGGMTATIVVLIILVILAAAFFFYRGRDAGTGGTNVNVELPSGVDGVTQ